jgi:signal recognition particle subunit SRP54
MSRRSQFSFDPEEDFTLDDFRRTLDQVAKLGPLNKIMGMIPGMDEVKEMIGDVDADGDLKRLRGIIDAMTPEERRDPTHVIDANRRRRIAMGSGADPAEVAQLVKSFDGMADLMKRMRSRFDLRRGQPPHKIWWQQKDWPPTSL